MSRLTSILSHPAAATKRDRRFFPIAGCPPPRGFVQRGFADALAPPSAASLAELCPALGLGKPPTLWTVPCNAQTLTALAA